jgi:hypothetical protein
LPMAALAPPANFDRVRDVRQSDRIVGAPH